MSHDARARIARRQFCWILGEDDEQSAWKLGGSRYLQGSAPSSLPLQRIGVCSSSKNLRISPASVHIESDSAHRIASSLSPRKQSAFSDREGCRELLHAYSGMPGTTRCEIDSSPLRSTGRFKTASPRLQSKDEVVIQYILRQFYTNKAYISQIYIRYGVFTAIIASILWLRRELSQVTC